MAYRRMLLLIIVLLVTMIAMRLRAYNERRSRSSPPANPPAETTGETRKQSIRLIDLLPPSRLSLSARIGVLPLPAWPVTPRTASACRPSQVPTAATLPTEL